MFANCTSLVFVSFSDFDTSATTDMSSMFEGCAALPAVNISGLNTASVTDMQDMFKDCTALRDLTISSINTASVTNMQSMFENCSSLKKLNLAGITAPSVTNVQSMFAGCEKLEGLNLSGFDMTDVTTLKDMFAGCASLATLTLPAFNAANATDMSGAFSGCSSLKALDFTGAVTTSATTMARMFEGCAVLESLDLSAFTTASVTDMEAMFSGCAALKTLDISGFTTSKVTSMNSLFADDEALVKITLGAGFAFDKADETCWLPLGRWQSSVDSAAYTAQAVAGLTNAFETIFTRQMTLDEPEANETSFVYDSTEKVPAVVVKSGDRILAEDIDYIVEPDEDSVNIGDKVLTIKGAGAYSGTRNIDYKITPAPITEFTLAATELTYDGTKRIPAMTVKAGNLTLDPATDFDVTEPDDAVNAGKKGLIVTAKGNFMGELAANYEIVPAAITAVEFDTGTFTYDGTEKLPAITVKCGDKTLVAGTDYELALPTERVNIGTKVVKATGKGNYTGDLENSYEIAAAAALTVSLSADKFTYDGKEKAPTVTVKCGDKVLRAGTDYDVTLPADRVKAGKKSVKVTAKGNYAGTLEAAYEIVPAAIDKIELSETKFTYDGKEKAPTVTVKCGDKVLRADTDYDVTLPADRVKAGKKSVKVTAKGNYAGTLEASYEIVEAPKPDTPDNPDNPGQTGSQPMYRLYNPNSGEHFFTASTVERQHLIGLGWNDEGQGWTAPKTGDAVYRLYNPNAGEHHYTLSTVERDSLIAAGWNDEGIGWYSDPAHGTPLYRVYNPNEFANNHHYTTNDFERGYLVALGWHGEGIAWYGVK
ncbi:MAG: BspA family leucine-rich repeat surface protein [Coriobacteriales bacterium]